MQLFEQGDVVKVVEQISGDTVIAQVVEDSRSEIELVEIFPAPGNKMELAHMKEFGGWVTLFSGLENGRHFSQRAPAHNIVICE